MLDHILGLQRAHDYWREVLRLEPAGVLSPSDRVFRLYRCAKAEPMFIARPAHVPNAAGWQWHIRWISAHAWLPLSIRSDPPNID